jgi:type-F conjugative transfer system pilin assembly protein TrbC
MAQKKLLFVVIMLAVIAYTYRVFAEVTDREWANNLSQDAMDMTWQNLKNQLEEFKIYGDDYRDQAMKKKPGGLMIFVSNSMSISLLKSYAKETEKYGGVLVFKGLPNGSFKALAKLVAAIQDKEGDCPMQIDDEAFELYGINQVPAIVLSKADDCLPWQTCKLSYDKITGNVGIRFALEKFKEEGELNYLAEELLQQ